MGINGVGNQGQRNQCSVEEEKRTENACMLNSNETGKADAKPKTMDMDRYAAAAEQGANKPQFGALADEPVPSLDEQIDNAIEEAKRERRDMNEVSASAADNFRALPQISRGAAVIVGTVSAATTVSSFTAASVEAAVTLDSAPLNDAVDNADRAVGYVMGDLNDKIDHPKNLYMKFIKQSIQYDNANRNYQNALRNRDYVNITNYSHQKNAFAEQARATAKELNTATRAAKKAEKHFDEAMLRAAKDAALTAVGVGLGGSMPIKVGATLMEQGGQAVAEVAGARFFEKVNQWLDD